MVDCDALNTHDTRTVLRLSEKSRWLVVDCDLASPDAPVKAQETRRKSRDAWWRIVTMPSHSR